MSKTSISSEVGWGLVKAYTTENPRPSTRQLAKRFGVSSASVQRYLKKTLALVIQPTQNEVEARMRVELAPAAIHEVNMLTKDHVLTKMRKVLGEAEGQYELLKESNPTLAGAYLREMRQTIETMGKWARIDQGEDRSPAVGVQVDHAADGRCQGCSRQSWTSREIFENGLRESAAYFESIEPLYCKE